MKPGLIRLELCDQNDQPFTGADLRGRHALVYFGFLHCRVVCPRTLGKLKTVLDLLGEDSAKLTVLYVTVDPARDTVGAMKAFISGFDPRFTGLTGSTGQIEAAKAAFMAFSQRTADPDDPEGYAMPHTAFIYLMDPEFRYLAHFTEGAAAVAIAAAVQRTLT